VKSDSTRRSARAGKRMKQNSRHIPSWGTDPAPEGVQQLYAMMLGGRVETRVSNQDVLQMLQDAGAPECVPEQLAAIRGWIGYLVWAREDSAKRAASPAKRSRPPSERIAAAVAELRRAIPDRREELMEEGVWWANEDSLPSIDREIARLEGLAEKASVPEEGNDDKAMRQLLEHLWQVQYGKVDGEFPPNLLYDRDDPPSELEISQRIPQINPRKHSPGLVVFLFHLYEISFGHCSISRTSPGVRFLEAAIKRIGWDSVERGAIEQMLRRWICGREKTLDRIFESLEETSAR
jgi:hypothetical protein